MYENSKERSRAAAGAGSRMKIILCMHSMIFGCESRWSRISGSESRFRTNVDRAETWEKDVTDLESWVASMLLGYIPTMCTFVAPPHPGASAAIIDRHSHCRALTLSELAC
jgi:hypothetical protein